MNVKFILYALLISIISSGASWGRMLAGPGLSDSGGSSGSRGGSSWSSSTGSGGGGGGGGHK